MKYVPILKWKRGERVGVRHLKENIKGECIPLLNIMRNSEPDTFVYQVQRDWGKNKSIYFDFHPTFIPDNDFSMTEYLEEFTKEIDEQEIKPIPVIAINKPRAVLDFINNDPHYQRAAIRIYLSEFDDFTTHLNNLISLLNINISQIDLIIDLEQINLPIGALNQLKLIVNNKINEANSHNFNSIIVAGSSFPEILSGINYWSITTKPRKEYLLWEKINNDNPNIIFSDYICDDPKDY